MTTPSKSWLLNFTTVVDALMKYFAPGVRQYLQLSKKKMSTMNNKSAKKRKIIFLGFIDDNYKTCQGLGSQIVIFGCKPYKNHVNSKFTNPRLILY